MVLTLTKAAKNWLAINVGSGAPDYCFSPTGVTYNDPDGTPRTGSTSNVVNAFWTAHRIAIEQGDPAKDNVDIKNGMTYVLFKAMNGNVDIELGDPEDMGDVGWAYNSDGHTGATLPLYCADPAHIISTDLTVDRSAILEGDSVVARATWTNDGALPGPFSPGVTVDTVPMSNPLEQLLAGVSVSYDFTISGLTLNGGIPHQICAYPGTHCANVYVFSSLGICNWIISRGGWNAITAYDIMVLADAYIGQGDLGFTITLSYIAGVISYYLKRRGAGNLFTGCGFLT